MPDAEGVVVGGLEVVGACGAARGGPAELGVRLEVVALARLVVVPAAARLRVHAAVVVERGGHQLAGAEVVADDVIDDELAAAGLARAAVRVPVDVADGREHAQLAHQQVPAAAGVDHRHPLGVRRVHVAPKALVQRAGRVNR